ncbi:HDIG domain-containing protein [Candidatus Gracilibacteria bacterium]|nr:HDIG domain-containing protein [Candidatus Gracilibacteria bacterium]
MDPLKIIQKYYQKDSKSYRFLVEHSKSVTKKAIEIARQIPHLNPDLKFIEEASMLHDIGIFLTNAPKIDCFGQKLYICHGYLGREILEKEKFLKHALVCERHIGVGISIKNIEKQKLPIPKREMIPISIEEQIICFADKFFSKNEEFLYKEKSLDKIKDELLIFGKDKVKIFDDWIKKFCN